MINLNTKIYVPGKNGFVGSNLISKLKSLGYNNIISSDRNVPLQNKLYTNEFIYTNKPEIVIICAARVGGIKENIEHQFEFLFDNLEIQNNLIYSCIRNKVKKVIFLGSSCIYPTNHIQPLKEEHLLDGYLEPTNQGYALSKICGLKLCEFANQKKLETKFISLMPCNLYGPGDCFDLEKSHVLSALVKKFVDAKKNQIKYVDIWGTGEQRREFLYIDDLIDCIIWAFNNLEKTDTFLNVGTGIDISIRDLSEKIASLVDYNGTIYYDCSKPNGMQQKCLDVTKINNLGWRSKVDLEFGLKKTINYYKEV